MRINNFIHKSLFIPLLLLFCAIFTGCTDDNSELMNGNSGYIQFKLYKNSIPEDVLSRASELDFLNDAKKIEVLLQYKGASITQTLNLNSYNDTNAEFGLRSDKLEMLAGDYTIIGYYLYNDLDERILSGAIDSDNTFTIISGGLQIKNIAVSVVKRGIVAFTLVKDFSDFVQQTRTTNEYLFSNVRKADITIQNLFTQETTKLESLPMTYKVTIEGNGSSYQSAVSVSDSLVYVKAGNYKVISYAVYNRSGNLLEFNNEVKENRFSVVDNELTKTNVPVTMRESDAKIKDYYALKKIWEAMDGENWYYYGENYDYGINWNFNKDVDMWGYQPGVELNSNGRVISLNLGSFGPEGDIPAAIGELTELNTLYLGTHNDHVGNKPDRKSVV